MSASADLLKELRIDRNRPAPPSGPGRGLIVGAKETEAAKALVKFITGPDAAAAFRKRGMEPG